MIFPVAERLYHALMMDSAAMLSTACFADFCLSGDCFTERFGALQRAVRSDPGATIEDLSEALGDPVKITALVKKYGSDVVFTDDFDAFITQVFGVKNNG